MKKSNLYALLIIFFPISASDTPATGTTLPIQENLRPSKHWGYSYGWDNWNPAINSPEYIGLLAKQIIFRNFDILALAQIGNTYRVLAYDQNLPSIGIQHSFVMQPTSSSSPQDLIKNRMFSCDQCLSLSNTQQDILLTDLLAQNLNKLAIELIPTIRLRAIMLSYNNPNFDGIKYYNESKANAFATDKILSYSIGNLGHYHTLVTDLLTKESFPTSDTTATMLGINPSVLYDHPLYLYFAANKWARNRFLQDPDQVSAITFAVLFHRFKVLKDKVNSENWKQNPDIADVYELLAIISSLIPGYSEALNSGHIKLPDLTLWQDAHSSANQLENLNSDLLQVISDANNYIENNMPDEINKLHAAGICPDGTTSCANYKKIPLLNFKQNWDGRDVQVFNWTNRF